MSEFVLIPGFEPNTISKEGIVISRHGKKLNYKPQSNGYIRVKLLGKNINVHRLVALTFIPNPNGYPMVNHKDGNKLNNHVDNLEWCTIYHNNEHAQKTGLLIKGQEVHTNVLDEIQVLTIRKCIEDGMRTNPLSEYFKVHKSTIDAIAAGRNWKHICTYAIPRKTHKEGTKNSKLTAVQVKVIKEAINNRHKLIRIAEYFKVNDVTIHNIKSGLIWKHIAA